MEIAIEIAMEWRVTMKSLSINGMTGNTINGGNTTDLILCPLHKGDSLEAVNNVVVEHEGEDVVDTLMMSMNGIWTISVMMTMTEWTAMD